jgi:hypothetical protein
MRHLATLEDLIRADGGKDMHQTGDGPLQRVWWLAPMPVPLSPWKYA